MCYMNITDYIQLSQYSQKYFTISHIFPTFGGADTPEWLATAAQNYQPGQLGRWDGVVNTLPFLVPSSFRVFHALIKERAQSAWNLFFQANQRGDIIIFEQ